MGSPTAEQILEGIAATHRVIILGGLAVIAHGHPRTTDDSGIWLDPNPGIDAWCQTIRKALQSIPNYYLFDIEFQDSIDPADLESTINRIGMIRIAGLNRYLDIFYQPNQLEPEDFDEA